MVSLEEGKSVGIIDLATFQGISETYLSKVYAKLSKLGIIKSVPGAKGGYALARDAEEISFWDIVEAVEGSESFFQCAEIRQNNILLDKENNKRLDIMPQAFESMIFKRFFGKIVMLEERNVGFTKRAKNIMILKNTCKKYYITQKDKK